MTSIHSLCHLSLWIFVGLFFFTGCDSTDNTVQIDGGPRNFDARAAFSFEVTVAHQRRIRLEAISGNVEINGKPGIRSVIVTGERIVESTSRRDADDHLDDLEVQVRDLTDEVFVQTIQPRNSLHRNYVVHYTITVPQDLAVEVTHVNGNLAIEAIENDVAVEHVNGNVRLGSIVGNAFAQVVNGFIDSDVTMPRDGTITLTTSNGGIDLTIPVSTSAELSASVNNGQIQTANLALQNPSELPQSLEGTLGDGAGTIDLTTLNGNINVRGRN